MATPELGGLDASLVQLISDHQHNSLRLRDHTERAKKDAIRSAIRVSDLLVDAANGGVQESFVNEKRIKLETRALAATVMRFIKQTDRWLAASHAINTVFKFPPISSPPLFTNYITRLKNGHYDLLSFTATSASLQCLRHCYHENTSLKAKEIGDYENWMRTMEFDCKSVSAAIYNIHQA
ncbi:hypothetical protein ACSBR1_033127 [Camellia fascicularis]